MMSARPYPFGPDMGRSAPPRASFASVVGRPGTVECPAFRDRFAGLFGDQDLPERGGARGHVEQDTGGLSAWGPRPRVGWSRSPVRWPPNGAILAAPFEPTTPFIPAPAASSAYVPAVPKWVLFRMTANATPIAPARSMQRSIALVAATCPKPAPASNVNVAVDSAHGLQRSTDPDQSREDALHIGR